MKTICKERVIAFEKIVHSESKNDVMKLTLAVLLLAPVVAFSQQKNPPPNQYSSGPYLRITPDSVHLKNARAVRSHKTSKGYIYTIPAGRMPCLVPDKSGIASMPNAMDRGPLPYIPNSLPKKDKPEN